MFVMFSPLHEWNALTRERFGNAHRTFFLPLRRSVLKTELLLESDNLGHSQPGIELCYLAQSFPPFVTLLEYRHLTSIVLFSRCTPQISRPTGAPNFLSVDECAL